MPKMTIEINDEKVEAQIGERLLDVARRNAAHIGFACDGQGLCTTCECRVLDGADKLNKPTEAELTWLPPARMRDGYRLGCQAALRGVGEVKVLTRAEELRRQFNHFLVPPAGRTAGEYLGPLVGNMAAITWQHVGTFPFNLIRTFGRLGPVRFLWPFQDLGRFVDDTGRVTQRMLRGNEQIAGEPVAELPAQASPSSQPAPEVPPRPTPPTVEPGE